MQLEECVVRRAQCAAEFDQHESRQDGARIVNSLAFGLNLLRNQMYIRVRDDVAATYGSDSMLMPVSPLKSEAKAKTEIEVYQVAVSASEAQRRGYVSRQDDWYANWLGALRLGDGLVQSQLSKRLADYLSMESERQRLAFERVLAKTLPEASKAPLIMYRLFPLAIGMVTAIAFEDRAGAIELRKRQLFLLPAIDDCHECHGSPLDNGEMCQVCGNPLWKYDWLTSSD